MLLDQLAVLLLRAVPVEQVILSCLSPLAVAVAALLA
jgi:hypothetical protein